MSLVTINEIRTVKLTRLAHLYVDTLDASTAPLATDYQLFLTFKEIYKNPEGLYLRHPTPSIGDYRRTRNLLIKANKLARDTDYPATYRILSKQDISADEVTCLVDPFCYISHLSAMQRYGLTNRRPEALHLTIPASSLIKSMAHEKMAKDYGGQLNALPKEEIYPLKIVHHPKAVRKRNLDIFSTANYGEHLRVRDSWARLSTIGQTFLDMLEEPQRCGGMAYVLEVWQGHARSYIDDIITAIDKAPKPIYKVRAGYILNEVMNIDRPEITKWLSFAQRGSSRILDFSKPFVNKFSEKWMLSINV